MDVMSREMLNDILAYAMLSGIAATIGVVMVLAAVDMLTHVTITMTLLAGGVIVFTVIPRLIARWTGTDVDRLLRPQSTPRRPNLG